MDEVDVPHGHGHDGHEVDVSHGHAVLHVMAGVPPAGKKYIWTKFPNGVKLRFAMVPYMAFFKAKIKGLLIIEAST